MNTGRQPPDLEGAFWPLHDAVRSQTMTSTERLYALYKAVEYVVRHDISGDFVECGVWRGGSVMMMALALRSFGKVDRIIHCYDTFEGMPPPEQVDVRHSDGTLAVEVLARSPKGEESPFWAISPLETVQRNLADTRYPTERVVYIRGKVEDTLPLQAPSNIALLRLDTDWYASTKHELVHLYPRLVHGGVIIIDDYGFWRGSRKAVDEYFAESGAQILLSRIDDTGRVAIKLGS